MKLNSSTTTLVVFILVVFTLFFVVKFMGVEKATGKPPPSKPPQSLTVAQAFQCSNNWVNTDGVYSCNGTTFKCPLSNNSVITTTNIPTQILCMNPSSKTILQQFGLCKVVGGL